MKKTKLVHNALGLSLITLLAFSILSTSAFAELSKNPNSTSIKIQQTMKISNNSYYVKFNVCVGKNPAVMPTFEITSDTHSKTVSYNKTHQANTCKLYDAYVNAKYSSNIVIKMVDKVVKK